MKLTDKVYFLKNNLGKRSPEVLETTVKDAIKTLEYDEKEFLNSFKKQKDKSNFKLTDVRMCYVHSFTFYFKKNDAIKESVDMLNEEISKKMKEVKILKDKIKEVKKGIV